MSADPDRLTARLELLLGSVAGRALSTSERERCGEFVHDLVELCGGPSAAMDTAPGLHRELAEETGMRFEAPGAFEARHGLPPRTCTIPACLGPDSAGRCGLADFPQCGRTTSAPARAPEPPLDDERGKAGGPGSPGDWTAR